jgi:hypothetical protein
MLDIVIYAIVFLTLAIPFTIYLYFDYRSYKRNMEYSNQRMAADKRYKKEVAEDLEHQRSKLLP